MAVWRLLLLTCIQLVALIFQNQYHAVGNAQELGRTIVDLVALFKFEIELDDVEVRDELLNLAVSTLVHLKDRVETHHDLLLENELRPVSFSVFLMRKIAQQHANLDLILRRNLLNQIHGDLLSNFLSTEHILQYSV